MSTDMTTLLRKLEMTEKRQTEALEQTKSQILALRNLINNQTLQNAVDKKPK